MRNNTPLAKRLIACIFLGTFTAVQAANIVIDVGHNLSKPGTTSAYGETEFSYNKALAEVVTDALRQAGHQVTVIGADGQMLELKPRAEAAAGYDLFISIHHDSMKEEYLEEWLVNGKPQLVNDKIRGYSAYVYPEGPHFATSLRCASLLSKQLQQRGFTRTLHHADGIAGENRPLLDRELGIYSANFAVLRHNSIPAILFEAGVIPNPDEAKSLRRYATQRKIADAIVKTSHCLK